MGVADRVADYAQKPALHEGRGMVAGHDVNVPSPKSVPWSRPQSRLCKLVAPAAWRGGRGCRRSRGWHAHRAGNRAPPVTCRQHACGLAET